jgi:hypothetical protein
LTAAKPDRPIDEALFGPELRATLCQRWQRNNAAGYAQVKTRREASYPPKIYRCAAPVASLLCPLGLIFVGAVFSSTP